MTALLKNGAEVKSAKQGDEIALVANQTPFYGESGGQMGDTGDLVTANGAVIQVTDTQRKLDDLFVHLGKVSKGEVKVGDVMEMRVDGKRRTNLRAHHSATHLLHEALRRRLGNHVTQKGSLVAPDRLRFDFSHSRGMTPEDIATVENEVNNRIRANAEVETRLMTPDAAIEAGAMALFGEKYGEEVRVVSMGGAAANENKVFSTELCGGTHVRRTGDIGLFKIVSEGAVGAGRAPHRGGDGCRGGSLCRGTAAPAERSGCCLEDHAGRVVAAHRGAGRGAQAPGPRTDRRAQAIGSIHERCSSRRCRYRQREPRRPSPQVEALTSAASSSRRAI